MTNTITSSHSMTNATVEAWVCDKPPADAKYRVLRAQWIEDYNIRVIHEVELVPTTDQHKDIREIILQFNEFKLDLEQAVDKIISTLHS